MVFFYLRIVYKTLLHKLFELFISYRKVSDLSITLCAYVLRGLSVLNKRNLIKMFYYSQYDIYQTRTHNQKKYEHELSKLNGLNNFNSILLNVENIHW